LRDKDVDFCYGSCDGQLWPVFDRLFSLNLQYDNSAEAVAQRLAFLEHHKIGICDIVESCRRERMDASDATMQDICLRDLIGVVRAHQSVEMVVFTGGNSRNGPEYLFRRQLAEHHLALELVDENLPRRHRVQLFGRTINTVSLTSPSNAANRAIGAKAHYKRRRQDNGAYSIFDFRLEQYGRVFVDR
jgi:G:T/U-mismatch repair DNA glycosylase